ncbi:unnamed protein product [Sympodiomycopsis kandeliae]
MSDTDEQSPTTLARPYSTTTSSNPVADQQQWDSETRRNDRNHILAFHLCLAVVVLLAAIYHVLRWIAARRGRNRPANTSLPSRAIRAARAWVRKYLIYHTVPTPYFVFSGIEVVLLVCYTISMVIFAFNNSGNPPQANDRVADGFSNRCAHLFVASLPWIVLLSTKNNPISFFTGIPYERLQIYHRGCSRISLCFALTHVVTKLHKNRSLQDHFRIYGLIAFVLSILIWFTSMKSIMNKGYQIFMHLHDILVLGFLAAIWLHTNKLNPTSERIHIYLYITAGIWLVDRAVRIFQMIDINLSCRPQSQARGVRGFILSQNMIRLEIHKAGLKNWKPGQHVYLVSSPGRDISWIFEGHPFSIASVPPVNTGFFSSEPKPSAQPLLPDGGGGGVGEFELQQSATPGTLTPYSTLQKGYTTYQPRSPPSTPTSFPGHTQHTHNSNSQLVLLIRVRNGFTRRLYDCIQSGRPLKLLVYGPFSPTVSFQSDYETMVLFAGGAGVSWSLPLLLLLCRRATQRRSVVKQIIWIWCVPSRDCIPWAASAMSAALNTDPSAVTLDIRIYITQEHAHRRDPPREWTEVASGKQRVPWILQGRPHVAKVVESYIANAVGRLWIGVSGPPSLSQTVQSAARECIDPRAVYEGDDKRDITVHCQPYQW